MGSTLTYITKGGNYRLFGITEEQLRIIKTGTSYKLAEVAADIVHDPDINRIARKYPCHFIHYHGGISRLCAEHRRHLANVTSTFDWSNISLGHVMVHFPLLVPIYNWFDTNFRYLGSLEKPLRSKQMWIHGPTGYGKSRFLAFLSKHWRSYIPCTSEKYYDGYNDVDVDFIKFDDFFGKKPITELNLLLAGQPMVLPFKGGQYVKRKNKPVIFVSNSSPEQLYSRFSRNYPMAWEAFLDRIIIFDVGTQNLHNFVDYLIPMSEELPPLPIIL